MANTVKVSFVGDTSDLAKKFDDLEREMKDVGDSVSRSSKEMAGGFDGVRDSADNTERRVVGFRDSLTGTADVMTGIREGNLVVLATGFADLASSVANLGADLLEWGKKAWNGARNAIAAHGASAAATAKDTAAMVAHKAATIASEAASKAAAAAQWLLNAAMSANPVMLVVVALAALVAAFVLAWQNSETFREIVTAAFDTVKGVVMGVFNWVKDNWPLLLGILTGPIGLAVLAIVKNWDEIKGAAMAAFNWVRDNWPLLLAIITGPIGLAVLAITKNWDEIKGGFTAVKDWISEKVTDIVGTITGLPSRISSAAFGMFDGIKEAFKSALNWIIDGWNNLEFEIPGFDPPGPGPKFGGFTLGVPDIPRLALGGITTGPTAAILGDNPSGREAVIPLDDPRARGMLGGNIEIVIMLDSDVVGRATVKASNRAGGLPIRIRTAS